MYCTVAYFVRELSEKIASDLSNDTGEGTVDESLIESIIIAKSDYIDNSLRGRYTLPLTNQHTILQEICFDLSKVKLYSRREGAMPIQDQKSIIDYAELRLKQLQNGDKVLDEGEETPEPDGNGSYLLSAPDRIYTKCRLDRMP